MAEAREYWWYGYRRSPGPAVGDARLRLSDAERKEMADTLSRHYADGRLDTSEFEERVGRALAARTRGDLAGLLDDLPALHDERPKGRRRLPLTVVMALVLAVLVLAAAATAATHVPWVPLAIVGWILYHRRHRHRDRPSARIRHLREGAAGGWMTGGCGPAGWAAGRQASGDRYV